AYAEAGHLTWGYASTLHKAPGATLDQTFLLGDDSLHRERSYSGLSRGIEANDVYLAVPEDEDHHGASDVDDLMERLRQTVNRSDAKTLAVEDLLAPGPPTRSAVDGLRAERLRLAPIVNRAPHPPFDALAALEKDEQRARANLARARRERQAAEEAVAQLGGHRRLTRRHDRQRAEERFDRATGAEANAETTLEFVGERRTRLNAELAEWKTWTAEHGHEASRLREVDSLIAEHRRQHQPTLEQQRRIDRDAGRDVGIDLGL
ncbi:MAG: hypothetical protein LC792_10710, partial [Actinobacteria bacterium]|nr:hypothetical protein [Actinomycetota bacterium]